jgi:hypothetical protein
MKMKRTNEVRTMDFIEKIFHVAPDAGSGVLELTTVLVFLMFLLGVVALRIRAGGRRRGFLLI